MSALPSRSQWRADINFSKIAKCAEVAQLAEHGNGNAKVTGSIPVLGSSVEFLSVIC